MWAWADAPFRSRPLRKVSVARYPTLMSETGEKRDFARVLVSACLLGKPIRYHGKIKMANHPILTRWQAEGRVIPFCPEIAGGLPTPRPSAEITPGREGADVIRGVARVTTSGGHDQTEAFVSGAWQTLEAVQRTGCRYAVLTDGSPSCGSLSIYDGRFAGKKRAGMGVTAALLLASGIKVFTEDTIDELDHLLVSAEVADRPDGPRLF